MDNTISYDVLVPSRLFSRRRRHRRRERRRRHRPGLKRANPRQRMSHVALVT